MGFEKISMQYLLAALVLGVVIALGQQYFNSGVSFVTTVQGALLSAIIFTWYRSTNIDNVDKYQSLKHKHDALNINTNGSETVTYKSKTKTVEEIQKALIDAINQRRRIEY